MEWNKITKHKQNEPCNIKCKQEHFFFPFFFPLFGEKECKHSAATKHLPIFSNSYYDFPFLPFSQMFLIHII